MIMQVSRDRKLKYTYFGVHSINKYYLQFKTKIKVHVDVILTKAGFCKSLVYSCRVLSDNLTCKIATCISNKNPPKIFFWGGRRVGGFLSTQFGRVFMLLAMGQ
jgi:hypothetical protein